MIYVYLNYNFQNNYPILIKFSIKCLVFNLFCSTLKKLINFKKFCFNKKITIIN